MSQCIRDWTMIFLTFLVIELIPVSCLLRGEIQVLRLQLVESIFPVYFFYLQQINFIANVEWSAWMFWANFRVVCSHHPKVLKSHYFPNSYSPVLCDLSVLSNSSFLKLINHFQHVLIPTELFLPASSIILHFLLVLQNLKWNTMQCRAYILSDVIDLLILSTQDKEIHKNWFESFYYFTS